MPTTAVLSSSATGAYRTGEKVVAFARKTPLLTSASKAVAYVHGATGDATRARDPAFLGVPTALAGAGYFVLSGDFGDPTLETGTTTYHNWGNDNAVFTFHTIKDFLTNGGAQSTFGVGKDAGTTTFFVYAGSMGALTILNYLISLATPGSVCAGVALTIPVLDLDNVYQTDGGGFRAAIGSAHGVTFPTALPALATHSPIAYSAPNKAKLTMPIRIWASSNDTAGSDTATCQTWATSVGSNVTVVNLGAHGHSAATLAMPDLLAFYASI